MILDSVWPAPARKRLRGGDFTARPRRQRSPDSAVETAP